MYEKNLTEDLRLRLSTDDMDFLRDLSAKRSVSVSECIRSIIGEYRRSVDALDAINKMILLTQSKEKGGELSHGDTETNIDD